MDPLISLLDNIFDREFPGSRHPLGPVLPESSRIGGYIVWNKFEDQSMRDRQRVLWKVIDDNVDAADQRRITAILTFTDLEEQAMLEKE